MRWTEFVARNAHWLATGALLTFLSSFGQTFFISIFAAEIRGTFGLSHGAWGGIYAVGTTASALVMVFAGGSTDHFRVRILGPLVLAGLAMACLGAALNTSALLLPVVIFALRFFGQGMASHIAMVAMARWFVATRGRALALATLGFAAGEALLPLVFVALMLVFDWRLLWVLAALIALCGIPILIRLLRSERTPQSHAREFSAFGMDHRHWTRRDALHHPLYWILFPALLGPPAFGTAFFFHQVHFAEIKGWAHLDLVALFPLYTVTAVVSMFASGWALDRWGTARLLPWCQLPLVVAFTLFATTQSGIGIAAGFMFFGIATGAFTTLPSAFWAEFYGTAHIGAIKSLAAAVMVLGSAIGPGLTGYGIDLGLDLTRQYGWIAVYFVMTTILMNIGIGGARHRLPLRV